MRWGGGEIDGKGRLVLLHEEWYKAMIVFWVVGLVKKVSESKLNGVRRVCRSHKRWIDSEENSGVQGIYQIIHDRDA